MLKNFVFSWKMTIIALLLASLMLKASNWQWRRYIEKSQLVETYKSDYKAENLEVLSEASLAKLIYKKAQINGEFNYSKQFLIANRRDATGPGFWLITEFDLANSDKSILVSRGFIPFSDRNPENWLKYNAEARGYVTGVVQSSNPERSILSPAKISSQPEHIFMFPDVEKICQKFNKPCANTNFFIQKTSLPNEPIFPKESISIQVPPSTHFGYTFEWILLAMLTLGVSFFLQAFPGFFNRIFERSGNSRKIFIILMLFACFPDFSQASKNPDEVIKDALIIEHLGQTLDLNLPVKTELGEKKLGDFVGKSKPIILAPVYYECPRLCNLSQTGLFQALNSLKLKLGKDYEVLSISFNHKDTVENSKKSSEVYRSKLIPELDKNGWNFGVTDAETIQKIMNQIGFSFKEDKGEFIHSAGLVILTPEGVISRYFYGIQFAPNQLRLALLEASEGKIGDSFDRILMYCFRYDSTKGIYTLAIWKITRIICSFFALALGASLVYLKFGENKINNTETNSTEEK